MTCLTCGREIGEHSHNTRDLCNFYIEDFVGHKTFDTGERGEDGFPVLRHEPLTRAEATALWERAEKRDKDRAQRMPDEGSAIDALFEAWQRLKELGWKEPQYCPKDGSSFKVIELGSTGIFDCNYHGEWPDGLYMVSDDRDIYPTSTGVAMFKLLPEDQEKYDAKWKALGERYRAEMGEEDGYGKGVRDMRAEQNQHEMAEGTRCDGSCNDGFPCHC